MPVWPGTRSDACACAEDASWTSDGYAKCNEEQTAAGCISQPKLESQELSTWRGSYICIKRGETGQLLTTPRSERPTPTTAGKCIKGFKACGTGTYAKQRSICVKEGGLCPITGLVVSLTAPEGFEASNAATTPTGDGLYWFHVQPTQGRCRSMILLSLCILRMGVMGLMAIVSVTTITFSRPKRR